MNNWLKYLLEANIYLSVLYGLYWLLLRKETFYTVNRALLLAGILVSFMIPIIQVDALLPAQIQSTFIRQEVIIKPATAIVHTKAQTSEAFFTANKAFTAIYSIGVMVCVISLAIKLYSLFKSVFTHRRQQQADCTLVYLDEIPSPYSFLQFLFVSKHQEADPLIMQHELIHIRQKHSWDILFLEAIKIISWFNPVVYLVQGSLKTLHEFIADQQTTISTIHKDDYVNYLIRYAHHFAGQTLANHFSDHYILKNRIIMLYQKRSGKLARLKYLVIVPVCASLICASTLAFSKSYGWIKLSKPNLAEQQPSDDIATSRKKALLVKDGDMAIITDKLEIKEPNGDKHAYTAATLTVKEQKQIKHNYKADVHVIERASIIAKSAYPNLSVAEQTDTTFNAFYKHVGRSTRYPAKDFEAHTSGKMSVLIKTDQNGKIADVYTTKGLSKEIDAEVIRAIKSYTGVLPAQASYYSLPVTFAIQDANGMQLPFQNSDPDIILNAPKPDNAKELSEVIVMGYVN